MKDRCARSHCSGCRPLFDFPWFIESAARHLGEVHGIPPEEWGAMNIPQFVQRIDATKKPS